jgi:hypothetical protein
MVIEIQIFCIQHWRQRRATFQPGVSPDGCHLTRSLDLYKSWVGSSAGQVEVANGKIPAIMLAPKRGGGLSPGCSTPCRNLKKTQFF